MTFFSTINWLSFLFIAMMWRVYSDLYDKFLSGEINASAHQHDLGNHSKFLPFLLFITSILSMALLCVLVLPVHCCYLHINSKKPTA